MDGFVPQNPLEKLLVGLDQGEISPQAFVGQILGFDAVMLIDRDLPLTEGKLPPFQPFTFPSPNGFDALLLFSSLDRSSKAANAPGHPFKFALQASVGWILSVMPEDLGLVLNPGWPAPFEMSPEILKRLRSVPPLRP